MRRGRTAALLAGCAAAGIACAIGVVRTPYAGAEEGTTGTIPTATSPSATTTTTTTTATQPAPAAAPPAPKLIAAGVTVGRLLVGGLTTTEARALVRERFDQPMTLVLSPARRLRLTPAQLGARAELKKAIGLARRVLRPGYRVPLEVTVDRARVTGLLGKLGRELRREPVDARLVLRNLRPHATKDVPGRRLREIVAERAIVRALKTHDRDPIELPFEVLPAAVRQEQLKRAIVIRRESKTLSYFVGPRLVRSFRVATGQSSYPTPLGEYEIINKWRDPWWYPPKGSEWARDAEPIPPGPGNPLGTRWMGISAPYVGIHGTPDAASIGYSASHGCVRMLIPQVEWLFERVEVGTPVFIVSA